MREQKDVRHPFGEQAEPGSATALASAQTLTEDLQGVARRIGAVGAKASRATLQKESARLVPLAKAAGAVRLYLLAEELHERASNAGCADFATPLAELQMLLHQLILSVQATRNSWLIQR